MQDKPQIPNFNIPHIQLKGPKDISRHPLAKQAHELVRNIDGLPASTGNTNLVTLAGKLSDLVWCACEGITVNEDGTTSNP